jgi:folylpolyglutamate synthase/dihydropteroate synthase
VGCDWCQRPEHVVDVLVAPRSPRAADPAELITRGQAIAPAIPSHTEGTPLEGVRAAARLGSPVVVAGSLYLAGEVRANLS